MDKLHQLQQRMYSRQFRSKKDQFQLQAFKEEFDKGTLAYTAIIRVGSQQQDPTHLQSRLSSKQQQQQQSHLQEFNVLLDTGSTNVFLLGQDCNTTTCVRHKKYNTKYSRNKWNTKLDEIGYISGSSLGLILADDFQIGRLKIRDQPIHVGLKVDIPVIETAKWDGIVGLGYWHTDKEKQLEKDKSIIDNIVDRNLIANKVFTYYIKDNGGKASFGEILKEVVKNQNDIQYANVNNINEEAQWIIIVKNIHFQFSNNKNSQNHKQFRFKQNTFQQEQQVQDIKAQAHKEITQQQLRSKNSKQNPCKNGCKLLVDTGTYLNYIPTKWFTYFMPKSQFDFDKALCKNKASFPDIIITIQGVKGDFDLKVKPEQYMENFNDNDCTNSWTPDSVEVDTITLGQGFLRSFYTIFDFNKKQKQIGFYSFNK